MSPSRRRISLPVATTLVIISVLSLTRYKYGFSFSFVLFIYVCFYYKQIAGLIMLYTFESWTSSFNILTTSCSYYCKTTRNFIVVLRISPNSQYLIDIFSLYDTEFVMTSDNVVHSYYVWKANEIWNKWRITVNIILLLSCLQIVCWHFSLERKSLFIFLVVHVVKNLPERLT